LQQKVSGLVFIPVLNVGLYFTLSFWWDLVPIFIGISRRSGNSGTWLS